MPKFSKKIFIFSFLGIWDKDEVCVLKEEKCVVSYNLNDDTCTNVTIGGSAQKINAGKLTFDQ